MPHIRQALLVAIGALGAVITGCRSDEPLGSLSASVTAQAAGGQPCRRASGCQLAFTGQPSNTPAGAAIAPPVEVTVQDPLGNTVTGFTGNIRIAIGSDPAGGHLSGARTVGAVDGVARFSDLSIDQPGTGYTLSATSGPITSAQSAPFTISGPATHLAFTVQPTNTPAIQVIAPTVQVTALDVLGNPATDFTGNITMAISPGTGTPGATLAGTLTVTPVLGVAAFPNLSIDKVGAAYTLTATASGLALVTSAPFNITTDRVTQVVFTVQPSTTVAGEIITPAVQVSAQDAFGNPDPNFAGAVTISIGNNPGAGTLSGTIVQTVSGGVATFDNLNIDKAGSGYTLVATALGLTAATSAAFDIVAGPPTQLVFTVEPTNTIAASVIAPPVEVSALDAWGNLADFTGVVTVSITAGTGSAGATLSGTLTVNATNGAAVFSNLAIDKSGASYTLTATASGLPAATSTRFNISAGVASQLAFTTQPTNTVAGNTITPAVQVKTLDAFGNLVPDFPGTVAIAIATNPAAGTLSGTTIQSVSIGVANFGDLRIDKAGSGYTLVASAAGLTSATSVAFDIAAGPAARLVFTVQPTNTVAGFVMAPPVEVAASDAWGNLADFTGNVTVSITAGTGMPGATLSGTLTVMAANGAAAFSDLNIDKAGFGYTLTATATAPGLPPATSGSFNISPGVASQLAFTTQPTNSVAGNAITPAVQVAVLDALGNLVPDFPGTVAIAIATNPAAGTLSGTTIQSVSIGVANFGDLRIDKAGSGYTLVASAAGLTAATSVAFDIAAGPATHLTFTVQPTNVIAGLVIAPAVVVTAQDAFSNIDVNYPGTVTLSIGANAGGATLSGHLVQQVSLGVVTFSDLSIDKAGMGYTLMATSAALSPATSTAFDVSPGVATGLVFIVQPSNTAAGSLISPVQIAAVDALGNIATGFIGSVTVAIATNPGGGVLSGTTTAAAFAGIATFDHLSIDRTGTGYQLSAGAGGLTGATSAAFDIF